MDGVAAKKMNESLAETFTEENRDEQELEHLLSARTYVERAWLATLASAKARAGQWKDGYHK
jgi:hypothetical protein